MSKKKTRLTTALTPGKKRTHGGYTLFTTGKLPEHRKHIEQYLTAAREGLVRDLGDGKGEEDLSTAEIILIDLLITKLGVVRCMAEYIREHSVMEGGKLASPLKESFLAYNNSIRLGLQALGIKKRASDDIPSSFELAEMVDKENKRKRR